MERDTLLAQLAARGIHPVQDADIKAIEDTANALRRSAERIAAFVATGGAS
ncbi:hypothetical protein [Loktanella sp. IMCC34160]|uniref:hypothetical protein n=1 Tax=Loktanella sp. IMCC34160 TaxID=2510646 RepID=UPI0013EDBAB9|nr:hypothetical protein [Loktanella sp. IMCC34160]